jgi:hypothetical protein
MANQKRTENEILADLASAKTEYAALASSKETSVGALEAKAGKIKALGRELDATISAGANPCTKCSAQPIGMLKTPAYTTRDGVEMPAVFEVGCVHCPPFLVERENGKEVKIDGIVAKVRRRSFSARATSPAEAAKKWNEGNFVEDDLLDRIPGYTPEFV